MNGMAIPKFYEGQELLVGYYDIPDPFVRPKSTINILELSRYAKKSGKSPISMTKEEIDQFLVRPTN